MQLEKRSGVRGKVAKKVYPDPEIKAAILANLERFLVDVVFTWCRDSATMLELSIEKLADCEENLLENLRATLRFKEGQVKYVDGYDYPVDAPLIKEFKAIIFNGRTKVLLDLAKRVVRRFLSGDLTKGEESDKERLSMTPLGKMMGKKVAKVARAR